MRLDQIVLHGNYADRPAFGISGRVYYATDTKTQYLDTGSAWVDVTPAGVLASELEPFLLQTVTANNSSPYVALTAFSADYIKYKIEIANLVPASNNVSLGMLCSVDGGANYDGTAGNYQWSRNYFGSDGAISGGAGTGNFYYQDAISNTANRGGMNSIVDLLNLSTNAQYKKLMARHAAAHQAGVTYDYGVNFLGTYKVTTIVDALRISVSSGNWASGTVRLYGYKG